VKSGSNVGDGPGAKLAGPVYLDSSALVKLYLPESESDLLNVRLEGRRDLVASELAVTEVASAIGRRRREGSLSSEEGTRLYRFLLEDFEGGAFLRASVDPETHRSAERLMLSSPLPLRTLDALHLALATQAGAASMVTFDRRLGAAALSLGIPVATDEGPPPPGCSKHPVPRRRDAAPEAPDPRGREALGGRPRRPRARPGAGRASAGRTPAARGATAAGVENAWADPAIVPDDSAAACRAPAVAAISASKAST
jgi:uncharacterized protein